MEKTGIEEIPVGDIRPNPRQPRKRFDEEALEQMAQSIKTFGVVQAVIVRHVGTEYELIAGERRWRAAKAAGLEKVPAVIRDSTETDSLEIALIENLHRDDLNGVEEANAYQQLLDDFAITHEELSRRVGKSRVAITNTLRLLQLPAEIQADVMNGKLSTGHARSLLALQDEPELQGKAAARIKKGNLSVRQTEELCRKLKAGEEGRKKAPLPDEFVKLFKHLEETLDARVKGSVGKRKGRIVIEFRDMDDLHRIIDNMAGPALGGEAEEERFEPGF